jgi:hypothetical protein
LSLAAEGASVKQDNTRRAKAPQFSVTVNEAMNSLAQFETPVYLVRHECKSVNHQPMFAVKSAVRIKGPGRKGFNFEIFLFSAKSQFTVNNLSQGLENLSFFKDVAECQRWANLIVCSGAFHVHPGQQPVTGNPFSTFNNESNGKG